MLATPLALWGGPPETEASREDCKSPDVMIGTLGQLSSLVFQAWKPINALLGQSQLESGFCHLHPKPSWLVSLSVGDQMSPEEGNGIGRAELEKELPG